MKKILLLIFLFAVSNAKTQTIPSNRIADWSVAGYRGTIPTPTLIHDVMAFGATGNGVTDDASAIRAAIDSLHGVRGVIYFPAGTYLIASTIDLPDSVIIRGASADSTHLQFNFNSTPGNGFNILGSTGPAFTSVKAGYVRGSNYITVAD
jgi:hypothetical protein